MTQEHPITPSSELVEQWEAETAHTTKDETWHVAVQAARWGADQELEACLDEIYKGVGLRLIPFGSHREILCSELRATRRPKPPSLKEQALTLLDDASDRLDAIHENIIRRALESLPD